MSEIREKLKAKIDYKDNGILGDTDSKNRRVEELIHWMVRYGAGGANPKWIDGHAMELAHYIAEIKGM
jgi:hypothetical protein